MFQSHLSSRPRPNTQLKRIQSGYFLYLSDWAALFPTCDRFAR
jgi:hypothetical protein